MASFLCKEYPWHIKEQKDTMATLENISELTNNLTILPKEFAKNMSIDILVNTALTEGYIRVPEPISNEECKNAIRYGNKKDLHYRQLIDWFELDFAWYDEPNRKVMLWGIHEKVKETIGSIQEIFQKIEKEKWEEKEEYRIENYDPHKHT